MRGIPAALALVLLAWMALMWPQVASAQQLCGANSNCDEGQAMVACHAKLARLETDQPQLKPYSNKQCKRSANSTDAQGLIQASAKYGDHGVNGLFGEFAYKTSCSSRPHDNLLVNHTLEPRVPGSNVCIRGCRHAADPEPGLCWTETEGPRPGYYCTYDMTPSGATCDPGDDGDGEHVPPDKECTAGQVRLLDGKCGDQGDCPVGQHKVKGKCEPVGQCPAGKIKAPDGSCVDEGCPAGQAKGKDGTCKPDGDGDGDPDDGEDTGKFSGGDDCKVPPECSGDNILCGMARIQWRIDCNTRKNRTVTGGHGCSSGDVPICTGEKCDALEYAQLLQQWRAACNTRSVAGGGGDAQPAWTKVTGDGSGGGPEPGGVTRVIGRGIDGKLDSSGLFGGSGQCPRLGAIDLGDYGSFDLDSEPWFCDLLAMTRWILKLVGAFIALGILLGWRLG